MTARTLSVALGKGLLMAPPCIVTPGLPAEAKGVAPPPLRRTCDRWSALPASKPSTKAGTRRRASTRGGD